MKTNCKISKIIASLLVMATILCFGATGFAASYSTVTTYNLADNTVDVTSQVTGLSQNEQVTYLATNGAGSILYVNQEAAEEISTGVYGKTFTYSTTKDLIGSGTTTVKFGAATTSPIAPILPGTDDQLATVTVAVTAGDSYVTVDGYDANNGFTIGKDQTVTANVAPKFGYQIDSITVNGSPVDKALTSFEVATAGQANPSIVITTSEVSVPPALTGTTPQLSGLSNALAQREVSMFSTVNAAPSVLTSGTTEYGIIVLMSARLAPSLSDVIAYGTMYRAYGVGTGNVYAVRLVGNGGKTAGDKDVFASGQHYIMVPYLTVDGGATYVYGAPQSFTVD